MRTIRGLESYPPDAGPSAVALGAFDGIHLGHRAILGRAVELARARGLEALACTFDPHPMQVLQPARAPLPVTTLADRLALIGETGIATTVVIPFTRHVAAMEPEAFVERVLLGVLRAREVVVGFNHRFGRAARGDARLLEGLGARLGFGVHVVPPTTVDGVTVSSSEIRAVLGQGDLARAARLLGRDYTVGGPRRTSRRRCPCRSRPGCTSAAPTSAARSTRRWSTSGSGPRSETPSQPSRLISSISRAISTGAGCG